MALMGQRTMIGPYLHQLQLIRSIVYELLAIALLIQNAAQLNLGCSNVCGGQNLRGYPTSSLTIQSWQRHQLHMSFRMRKSSYAGGI
jgi:hypothetical protein